MYPWLQWTYAYSENATSVEIESHVSQILDIFGYLIFASPLFALLPELIVLILLSIQPKLKEKFNRDKLLTVILMGFICLSGVILSGQMMYRVNIDKQEL